MILSPPSLAALVRLSLTDPRGAARRLLSAGVPLNARWLGFALVIVLSVLLTQVMLFGVPSEGRTALETMMASPVWGAVSQAVIVLMLTTGIAVVGRLFGGQARFDDALLLMVWLEFVLFLFQILQIFVLILLPALSFFVGAASVAVFFWLLVGFTAEINGFRNRLAVLAGVIGTLFAAAFIAAVVATMFGWSPEVMPDV